MKNYKQIFVFIFTLIIYWPLLTQAQVSINQDNTDPDASAMLDIQSTDKGLLMPRMTQVQRNAIANPSPGLMIYNVDDSCFNYFSGKTWIADCGKSLDTLNTQSSAGGTDKDLGRGIGIDNEGNRYVAGNFRGSSTFGPVTLSSTGDYDLFLTKYNPNGEVEWAINEGGGGAEWANDVAMDDAGNIYVGGTFNGTATFGSFTLVSNGGVDGFVVKFNHLGQVVWAQKIGGTGNDQLESIFVDGSGNSYVAGNFSGTMTIGSNTFTNVGFKSAYVAKLDNLGQPVWSAAGFSSSGYFSEGTGIAVDAAGITYFAGIYLGPLTFGSITFPFNEGGFIARYDVNGQLLSADNLVGSYASYPIDITIDNWDNIFMLGTYEYSVNLGGFSMTSNGDYQTFLAKINPSNQIVWAEAIKATGHNWGLGVSVDQNGDPYVTGVLNGSLTIGGTTLNSYGGNDILVAKYNSAGTVEWAANAGGTDTDRGDDLVIGNDGICHTTGFFKGTATFGTTDLVSQGAEDVFLWEINGTTGEDHIRTESHGLSISQDGDKDNTNELQNLTLSGANLSISDGNSVDLSGIDTDDQTLSFSGTQLSIADGNNVDLSILQDNLGNHITTQNLQTSGNWLSGDGGNEGIFVDNTGKVGLGSNTPNRPLTIRGLGSGSELLSLENQTGTTQWHLNLQNNGLNFSETGVLDGRLFLETGGNIGIGTTNPHHLVDLGISLGRKLALYQNAGGSSFYGFGISGGTFELYAAADVSAEPKMVVKGYTGNVGIGMDDPLAKLTVNGSTTLYGDNRKISFKSYDSSGPNTQQSEIRTNMDAPIGIGAPHILDGADAYMSFHVSNTYSGGTNETLILRGNGHVGIGINNPDKKFHVHSDGGNTRFQAKTSGASSFTDWLNHDETVRGIVGVDGSGYSGNSNQFAISTWTAHPLVFRANQNEHMRITPNGNIGIGTSNPTKAKVEIVGGISKFLSFAYFNGSNQTGSASGTYTYSLYTSNRIAASEFNAHSDKRIKHIEGISDSKTDLTTLMQIDVTNYRLKDSISKGNRPIKKVIAQQVAEVYPQAVTRNLTEVVPDIYQRAEAKDGWIMLSTDLKVGDRVKLITEASSEIYEVIEAEATRFKVFSLSDFNSDLFVYGREVNDFHTVDYEAISMLNVSATQEQQARIEALEEENAILKTKVKQLHDLEARMQTLEALITPNR